jgi:hypothetical protein
MASEMSEQSFSFAALPVALSNRVFLLLPVDQRGRACCVCRAWRDALADPALWARLDLTEEGGVHIRLFDHARLMLHGAAARAQGRLHTLDVRAASHWWFSAAALPDVLAANADSMCVLRVPRLQRLQDGGDGSVLPVVLALCSAAPRLERLDANISCFAVDVPPLMRAEGPLRPLRIHSLAVTIDTHSAVQALAALLADMALQPTLSSLMLCSADVTERRLLDSLVDGLLARRVRELDLFSCSSPAAAPLARLLTGGALTTLKMRCLKNDHVALFEPAWRSWLTLCAPARRSRRWYFRCRMLVTMWPPRARCWARSWVIPA